MVENEGSKTGKKGITIVIALILIFGCIIVFSLINFFARKDSEKGENEKVHVQIIESKYEDLLWTLEQTGNVQSLNEVDVYPKVPGKIIKTLIAEKGDYVKEGALLATLEDNVIEVQLEEAKAALESARANLRQVEASLEVIEKDRLRLKNLYEEKAVSKQRLDHIEAKYKATKEGKKLAEAQIKRADAALRQMGILYDEHRIYAPISGYIIARYMDRGAISTVARPIVRISSEDRLKVVTVVTEKDFPYIKKKMKTEITVDAYPEKVFKGEVSIINPSIDPATRTSEIEVYIQDNDRVLKPGMFAHLKLYLGKKSSVVVPGDALNKLPGTGSYFVYVIEDGKAMLRNIQTGISQRNNVEVTDGLEVGEKIVVRGQNRLKHGTDVIIEPKEGNEA
ncbi:MAG: efflux RND transporter periplasmic adaptor subunit [Thermodesulfobacteriota bacterium]|nr:efflux RND transporter periplasmic adaptor subunit [Thermodesulfobacteriota bacterium]